MEIVWTDQQISIRLDGGAKAVENFPGETANLL
jgi:hypothetical protein